MMASWFPNLLHSELSLLVYFLLHHLVTCTYSGCPSDNSILEPCSCIHRPGTNILLCAGLKDSSTMDQVLDRSQDMAFHTLFVFQSNFKNIPSSALVSKKIKNVLVANSNMSSLFDKDPEASNLVEIVHINNVQFEGGIAWDEFASLGGLQYFNLQFGEVPELGTEITDHFGRGMKQFFMSNTGTKRLGEGVFGQLKELVEIKVRYCDIASLERSVFPKPAKLVLLDFTANQIESLPDDIFSDMPDLKAVILGENKITQISNAVLEFTHEKLEYLNLIGNPLNCDCALKTTVEKDNKVIDGNCAQPEDKKGISLHNLSITDFDTCS